MKSFLLAAFLCLISTQAFASLQISAATIGADGFTVTATMNDTVLSGSTASCFTFTGNISDVSNTTITPASITLTGGSGVTIVSSFPLLQGFANTRLVLAATPTCLIVGGTAGAAASQSFTPTNNSEYYSGGDGHWSGLVTYQGSPEVIGDGNGYPNTAQYLSTNGSIDFNVSSMGGTICSWNYVGTTALTLYEDGVLKSRQTISGTPYQQICFSGLDTGAHNWSLVDSAANGGNVSFQGLRIATPTFTTPPATLPIVVGCGASMMNLTGGGGAPINSDTTQVGLLKQYLGVVMQGVSYSGQDMIPTLRDNCPSNMVLLGNATPFLGIFEPDDNDIAHNQPLASIQTATQTSVTNIMANAHPPTKLIVLQPYLAGYANNTGVCSGLTYQQCMTLYTPSYIAGIAAAANSNVTFVHTNQLASGAPDWYDSTSVNNPCDGVVDTPDNLHACGATSIQGPGFGKITNRLTPIIAAFKNGSSFTISGGASSGRVGVASPAFTVSLPSPTTPGIDSAYWLDTITMTSSNSGDTVCIVGGSCGTGAVTLPASYSESSFSQTFQYTISPATTGARTISYTNLPDAWIAPASTSYSASNAFGSSVSGGVSVAGGARVQ